MSQWKVMDDISAIFKKADKDNCGTSTVKEIKDVLHDVCTRYPQMELDIKSKQMKGFLDLLKESDVNLDIELVDLDIEKFKNALARVDSLVKKSSCNSPGCCTTRNLSR